MPIILAQILRPLIIWIVQAGITYVGFSILEKVIDKLLEAIKEHYDLEDDDARILLANNIIDVALVVGVGTTTLASKMPVKVAEKLGITSKILAKKPLSAKGQLKTKTKDISSTSKNAAKATVASKIKGMGKTNILLWLMLAQGIGDQLIFGRTALQQWINDIFGKGTIDIPGGKDAPPGFSQSEWDGFLSSIEASGVAGISNPKIKQTQLFSKELLQDLMFWVYGEQVRKAESTTANALQKAVSPYLIFKDKQSTYQPSNTSSSGNFSSTSQSGGTSTSNVKVFTGIVSQGVVGQGLVFTPRPDDLIESVTELRDAAANNLAPFLATLPGKVVYEVKVVSSIVTKDGFKQTGTAQKVKTGTFADGSPKYKTVVNKFATLVLYIITDKNTRSKLATIVLGPVDSAKLQVGQNDLRALETQLPSLVTTQDINEIKGIETANPITVTTPPVATVIQPIQSVQDEVDTGFRFYSFSVNGEEYLEILPWLGNIPTGYTPLTQTQFLDLEFSKLSSNPTRWKAYFDDLHKRYPNALSGGKSGYYIKDGVPYLTDNAFVSGTGSSVGNANNQTVKPGANATTLSDWYQAQGQSLPPVSERALKYEGLGLGPSSYYTGTSEQNTKLLNALKSA